MKNYLKYTLHAAVLLGIVWAGVKYIDGDSFGKALRTFDWRYTPFVALLGVGSLLIKAWRFATLLKVGNDIPRAVAMKMHSV